ncbi:hypothetical protein U14_00483 [Candidatus Moduliflexus flocculans]|uniref:Solute-binding protein family 3/N-terminal domain-containing protein n=1 Tax=Candidatus Moduliflexus flocculans TaxID=1499966 RepID=A0A0S6VWW8_9BACT|nr:hypothetical protein U14_00483 [Candidatus Moduliflexus flocculans]
MMRHKKMLFLVLFCWMIASCIAQIHLAQAQDGTSASMVIRHPTGQSEKDKRYEYMIKLLRLILEHTTEAYGAYELQPNTMPMTPERMIRDVVDGKLDVIQFPISERANAELLPIRIPMRKGLLGWRILLIRKEDQEKFAQVKTLEDLKQFRAGYGEQWADLPVLQANVGNVVTSNQYDALFVMLAGKRFDYLHRGLHEPWAELEARKEQLPNLQVEETILLHYPLGNYLYVSQNNPQLAKRLEEGFRAAIADGSFEQLFQAEYGEIIHKANIKQRILIEFTNPILPNDMLPDDSALWLTFEDLARY